MSDTLEKLKQHLVTEVVHGNGYSYKKHAKPLKCKKGLTLSVQASSTHYCAPRNNNPEYGWTHVEIGFPTRRLEKLAEYAEEPKRMTKTVFGYVPIELVAEVIDDFGGIK